MNHIFNSEEREHYSALITLIQTGVRLWEKGLHNYTRRGRLPFVYVSTATTPQNNRNLSVLCQGFCVHSAVNCICFKVWAVLQDWNGQVASQDSHINSKSKSLAHSLQSQRPTLTSASFSLHTGINQELESRPQRWKQLQKIHPASEVARRYKTDFIS